MQGLPHLEVAGLIGIAGNALIGVRIGLGAIELHVAGGLDVAKLDGDLTVVLHVVDGIVHEGPTGAVDVEISTVYIERYQQLVLRNMNVGGGDFLLSGGASSEITLAHRCLSVFIHAERPVFNAAAIAPIVPIGAVVVIGIGTVAAVKTHRGVNGLLSAVGVLHMSSQCSARGYVAVGVIAVYLHHAASRGKT